MDLLWRLDNYITLGLYLVAAPAGVYAFIHALMQRADAFTAADKLSKPAWLGISGAGAAMLCLSLVTNLDARSTYVGIFWLAGLVAVLVYLVDVKPAVVGVQGGGQRW